MSYYYSFENKVTNKLFSWKPYIYIYIIQFKFFISTLYNFFITKIYIYIYIYKLFKKHSLSYLPTPLLGQDMTQGHF